MVAKIEGNLKTATALGLSIPPALRARAVIIEDEPLIAPDEVIE